MLNVVISKLLYHIIGFVFSSFLFLHMFPLLFELFHILKLNTKMFEQ